MMATFGFQSESITNEPFGTKHMTSGMEIHNKHIYKFCINYF